MRNFWVIGDLHGEYYLLKSLLENIGKYNPEEIIFLGDYIDRGAYSKQVVDLIMGLKTPVTCLMGNHEMMMINALEDMGYGYSPIELWYYNGAEATLVSFGFRSFLGFQSGLEQRYLDFFRNLQMNCVKKIYEGLKVLITHAGISPSIPLDDQLKMEHYNDLNRYMLEHQIDPGDSFVWVRESFFDLPASFWDGYLIVHGHTPTPKLKHFISSIGLRNFDFIDNDLCIRRDGETGRIVSIDIDSGSSFSGRITGLGFFMNGSRNQREPVRMRSITVSEEDIFPRDLGTVY